MSSSNINENSKKATKKQHYVPIFYLKYFAHNERLNVFDKKGGRESPSSYKEVAAENYFYEVPLVDEKDEKGLVENIFADLESHMAPDYKNFISSFDNKEEITDTIRVNLAFFTVIQFLRTQRQRQHMSEMILKFYNEIYSNLLTPEGLKIGMTKENKAIFHIQTMFSKGVIDELTDALLRHIMFICIDDESRLITSDNPVVRIPHNDRLGNAGFLSEGIEIAWPLSPKYILVFKESGYHDKDRCSHMQYRKLTKEDVNYYNKQQICRSYRQVYSKDDIFYEQARSLLLINPSLKFKD